LKLLALNVEPPFRLLNANRIITASADSATPSVASLAATRGARTLAARGREAEAAVAVERNAKDSKSFAINAANPTPCPSNRSQAGRYYAVLALPPVARRIAGRDARKRLTYPTPRR